MTSDGTPPLVSEGQSGERPSTGGDFDLCEVLFKRRNGFGKRADTNWVPRCFTYHGGILCYYEEDNFEDVDPSRPRGRVDLRRDDTKASYTDVKKLGAPTKYLIILQIFVLGGIERKWKMCCNSKSQQMRWYQALKEYDGPAETNVGDEILDFLKIKPAPTTPRPRKMTTAGKIARGFRRASFGKNVANVGSPKDTLPLHHPKTPLMIFISVNALLIISRTATISNFWLCVIVVNVIIKKAIDVKMPRNKDVLEDELNDEDEEEEEDLVSPKTAVKVPYGKTFDRAKVNLEGAGAELKAIVDKFGWNSKEACREVPKHLKNYAPDRTHSYWNGDGTIFRVRMGPNYKRTGKKEPSKQALFDLYAMDLIRAEERTKESRDIFETPVIPGITDQPTGHPHIPPMIIINCGMPSTEPSLFSSTDDGPSFVTVFYFVISEDTKRQLQDLKTASPAVRLLGEWCRRAENEPNFRGRFKAMCILDEIEKLGLPNPIPSYNGKPVLINKSGAFFRREGYIEHTINVHLFAYLAKKALYSIQPKFPNMRLNVGFVIEGRDDDELPECMLGVGKCLYMDPAKAPDDLGLD
mmetsp:Transcript_15481/g.31891  ORF Transcript_15481/g.31891 Transcript_15481/m.31891 type:complete len:581 (+) Transcript_15481:142-1884(+)